MAELGELLKTEYHIDYKIDNKKEWFAVKDIIHLIGMKGKVADILYRANDEEKQLFYHSSSHRNIWYVNESGALKIIYKSTLPNAKVILQKIPCIGQININNCKESEIYYNKQKSNARYNKQHKEGILLTGGNICCEICGWNCYGNRFEVQIHHIETIKNGGLNEKSNLMMLCPNHYSLVQQLLSNLYYKDQLTTKKSIIETIDKYENDNIHIPFKSLQLPEEFKYKNKTYYRTNEYRNPKKDEYYLYGISRYLYNIGQATKDFTGPRIILSNDPNLSISNFNQTQI